jgi:protein-S-isoprenylcysteine O-methyltransferase Ste14
MGLGTPLVLGSWPAELVMLPMTALVAARIVAEERLLVARLDGYAAYTKATRWRLLPGVW